MAGENNQTRLFLPDFCSTRSVLVVVIMGELLAVVLTLSAALYEPFSFQRLALSSFFVQWVGLTAAAILCALGPWLNRAPRAWAASAVVAVVITDTFLFSLVSRAVIQWAVSGSQPEYRLWNSSILIHVAIAAIIAGVVMRYFYIQGQLRIKDEAALQARIQALQSRIRPHFLFNSMNIIASLIAVDPDAAESVVEDLSRLFRASLKDAGHEVPLEEELELCRRYVHIEQFRMGERLHVDWDVQVDTQDTSLPLLTLQPLLENAIYHGIQPLAEGGTVEISAAEQDGRLVLRVRNPLPAQESQHKGNRMALENIRHRLEALYGASARVAPRAAAGHYEVEISFPLVKQ